GGVEPAVRQQPQRDPGLDAQVDRAAPGGAPVGNDGRDGGGDHAASRMASAVTVSTTRSAAASDASVPGTRQTASVNIPAARPACTPGGLSSITTHADGSTPSREAARRNMSGAGLPCSTSSPATITSNASSRPARPSVRCSRSRGDDDATATGTPRARSERAAPTASSKTTSEESISANRSPENSTQNASAAGRSARSAKYACTRG